MTPAKPEKEHEWLQQLVGEWTYEHEASAGPDQPMMKFTGTETVRSIGGLWVMAEGRGEMPGGGAAQTFLTVGYDPEKKRFVGTWFGSMMTYLWVYDGELDAGRNALVLHTVGPNFETPGAKSDYRETIAFKSPDHRTFTSAVKAADGSWKTIMTADYYRKK